MSIHKKPLLLSTLLLFAFILPVAYSQPITWEKVTNGMGDTAIVTAMAGDAQGRLFAGARYPAGSGFSGGFYRSDNNGNEWISTCTNYIFSSIDTYFAIDTSGWIYAGVPSGLYLSTDQGTTWTKTGIHEQYGAVSHVHIDRDGYIFATTDTYDEGLHRSTDQGDSWEMSLSTGRQVTGIASNSRGTLFVGINKVMGSGGLTISTDHGYTWQPGLFTDWNILSIVVDHADRVFVSADGFNSQSVLFRSSDDGYTWDTLSAQSPIYHLSTNSIDQLFGATTGQPFPHGIIRSNDHGTSWIDVGEGLPDLANIQSIFIAQNDYVFLGLDGGHGLYRSSTTTTSVQTSGPGADSYLLGRNYPNPVTGSTTIPYTLPREERVSLTVLNTLGQVVTTLVDEHRGPGAYEARWQAAVPAGLYFYRLRAGTIVETRKMIVR